MIEPVGRLPLSRVTHTIRAAQTVLQYGVGAMIDFPDQTLMTAAPEYWDDKILTIHDERLEKALRVSYFGMPGGKDDFPLGISYARFPKWYFCPECRRFQPIERWVNEYRRVASAKNLEYDPYMKRPRCMRCKRELVITRVVVACENGHIDDFPWVEWAHEKNKSGKEEICANPQLTFQTGVTSSAGLEGLEVRCETCKAKASLFGAFDKENGRSAMEKMGSGYKCTGFHPWKNQHEVCDEYPRAIQRGASAAYFPKVVSSLVIPPYSDRINVKIEQSEEYKNCLIKIEDFEADEREDRIRRRLNEWAARIARQISVNADIVKSILERRWLDDVPEEYTTDSEHYRTEEFRALNGQIPANELDSDDFIRESVDVTGYDIPGIKSIALIRKVREVRALTGFTRLNPPGSSDLGVGERGFVSIKEPATPWYPAYEVRGEGIFIEYDNEVFSEWLHDNDEVYKRANTISSNYATTYRGQFVVRQLTPKFIFLHSLSHLLIRQLSFECGYTAASLRERIYCSDSKSSPMAGMLIYTASGDSEGTLGGLVRQGYSDCFPRVFKKAIESGRICSNDPVCISSKGQGRDALNLAACHTCLLLPETSCEEFNVFLDRAMVIGTFEYPDMGFYSRWNP